MFIAMNRFKIKPGHEEDFLKIWRERDSHLERVPGFKQFNLLRGATSDEHTLFASHSEWESREAFEAWTPIRGIPQSPRRTPARARTSISARRSSKASRSRYNARLSSTGFTGLVDGNPYSVFHLHLSVSICG